MEVGCSILPGRGFSLGCLQPPLAALITGCRLWRLRERAAFGILTALKKKTRTCVVRLYSQNQLLDILRYFKQLGSTECRLIISFASWTSSRRNVASLTEARPNRQRWMTTKLVAWVYRTKNVVENEGKAASRG